MKRRLGSFYRGDTKTFKIVVADIDDVPVDITGWEFWFTMKADDYLPDTEAVIQKHISIPLLDAEGLLGNAYVVLLSTETEVIPIGTYFYDFQRVLQQAPGDPPSVTTIMSGTISVISDITRSV